MANMNKLIQAKAETVKALNKALSYSEEFQKPAQIDFYRAHIAYLDSLAARNPIEQPKADLVNWDKCRCVLDAIAAKAVDNA